MSSATPLLSLYVFLSSVIISTKYKNKQLSIVELTFLLEPPFCMCTTLFGGQQGSVQHKVTGCCDVCQETNPVHHHLQRHLVCVTSALKHSLYNKSMCMHTALVTVAQFQLLHNLPPPTIVTFWVMTVVVLNLFGYLTRCKPFHFLCRFTWLGFIHG